MFTNHRNERYLVKDINAPTIQPDTDSCDNEIRPLITLIIIGCVLFPTAIVLAVLGAVFILRNKGGGCFGKITVNNTIATMEGYIEDGVNNAVDITQEDEDEDKLSPALSLSHIPASHCPPSPTESDDSGIPSYETVFDQSQDIEAQQSHNDYGQTDLLSSDFNCSTYVPPESGSVYQEVSQP